MNNRNTRIWTNEDAKRLLRYGLLTHFMEVVALIAIIASGCYARSAHAKVSEAYRYGYEAGCNDTIERLLPSDEIPVEPWGEDDEQ